MKNAIMKNIFNKKYIFLKLFILFILFIIIILLIQIYCFFRKESLHEVLYPDDYGTFINEEKYGPDDSYKEIVKRGYKIMKTKKLVVGGLFYNASNVFEKFKKRMNKLMELFQEVQIVIFENDSTDNSRILLLDWEKEQRNVHIIKCKENDYCLLKRKNAISHGIFSKNRISKMIEYRNIIKKYLDDNLNHYDYFMVIDTDTRGGFSMNGLAYSFGVGKDWDMMSAYGVVGQTIFLGNLLYYDLYALYLNDLNLIDNIKHILNIYLKNINDDLIPINNAFGGLTIYKISSIRNVDYTPKDNKYICEHTIFTNNMRENGYKNFYINPKLLFLVGKQGNDYHLYTY